MTNKQLLDMCFSNVEGFIEFSLGGLNKAFRRWVPTSPKTAFTPPKGVATGADCYFGPAVRKASGQMGKVNVLGSQICWVDVDSEAPPKPVFPPSAVVWSGHGWHLYWKLDEFCTTIGQVEQANKALARTVGGDSAHNIDRLLRIPGTLNTKSPPSECKLVSTTAHVYSINCLTALALVPLKVLHKITTGDRRGYPSRSERDLAIIRSLLTAEFDTDMIHLIFQHCSCGDKYNDPRTHDDYLPRTIKTALGGVKGGFLGSKAVLVEHNNCYHIASVRGQRQISTFTITPTMLLEGSEDFIVGDIRAACTEFVWKDVVIPQSALRGLGALNRQLTKMAWTWLGKDSDVRTLQAHLMDILQEQGIPRAHAVHSIGRHQLPGSTDTRIFFACNTHTLASDGSIWSGALNNPLLYVPTGREAPTLRLTPQELPTPQLYQQLAELLPKLNKPECIWPMVGWHAAAPFKTALERLTFRFPILNVTGTRGSGKTTLLVQVFQRLAGYEDPRSYNSSTTHFVSLSLLGSTNSIPIAFSEFRSAISTDFLRYILLSYDTGRDARGRPDQTTQEYPLTAPFTLDGEDRVDDPAALERIVSVVLSPQTIQEGGKAWLAHQALVQLPLEKFAYPYIQFTLTADVPAVLQAAIADIEQQFPMILPTRIRRNITVCWFGIRMMQQFFELHGVRCWPEEGLDAAVLTATLENVYSTKLGRAPTAADSFVEFVLNASAQKVSSFPWSLEDGVLWFQLTPAFDVFRRHRALQRLTTLSRDAVRIQLREWDIPSEVRAIKGRTALVYGVSLTKAYDAGLDVPESFSTSQFIMEI